MGRLGVNDFDLIRPIYTGGPERRLLFYDVFRGLHGKVYALAPLYAVAWNDPAEHFATFDAKTPPLALVGDTFEPGFISDVFIDQRSAHYFLGSTIVYPQILRLNWHANLFIFDVTSPDDDSIDFWFTATETGVRHKQAFTLPEPPEKRFFCSETTLFRDDDEIISEWLDHCKRIGMDRFILYDNFSEKLPDLDAYPEVLLLDWPFPYWNKNPEDFDAAGRWNENQGLGSQIPQQIHALYKYGSECEWMAFFDTDEYLNLLAFKDLHDLLDPELHTVLMFPSLYFGPHTTEPDDPIMLRYRHREPPGEMNGNGYSRRKPIVNPSRVRDGEHVGIHDFCTARDPVEAMRKDNFANDVRRQLPLDMARLNHYFGVSSRRRNDEWPGEMFMQATDETILR